MLNKISKPSDIKLIKPNDLPKLAQELRDFIIATVSETGGHLASSLGVVELTIALFVVFDLEKDKLVWDVGHQSYIHKILTDRYENFNTLRQYQGISGFPKIAESKYDAFGTGHSSTSISAALGLATARDLKKEESKVIAVVGDGAMTGGLAFEGLNNAGHLGKDMLVILNDNEMFISARVGALGKYFTRILSGGVVRTLEEKIDFLLEKFKLPASMISKLIKRVKTILTPGMLFEELGFYYYGPVDGHNIDELITILEKMKRRKGPKLLHIVTKKGKGFQEAENDPCSFHGVGKSSKNVVKTYTQVFGDVLVKEAEADNSIVAVTAAMCTGTGLCEFSKKFPDRYFDVGIAEAHALTFSAGLAANGLKPVVAIYSTFLQRGYDQMIHDICLQNLPVIIMIDRAGIVGEDGATHNGVFDIAYLRIIPNLTLMSPKDENELACMLKTALTLNKPVAIRYPRGTGENVVIKPQVLKDFKPEIIFPEGKIAVVATGNMVHPAKRAIEKIGKKIKLVNLQFVKPLDADFLRESLKDVSAIVTVEEHVVAGGIGSLITEVFAEYKLPVFSFGIPDTFVEHGKVKIIRDLYNLNEERLAVIIKQIYANFK
ncbi:MAG: 1-deoxy-D-xylulose-5-phosphate synthase [bacterium]|nr:1-deoxy-D-xylulose-5-phosphate synthase [bacterium]